LDRVGVDADLGPAQALAPEEVLRGHAVRADRGAVDGDGGVGVAQDGLREHAGRVVVQPPPYRICGPGQAFSSHSSPIHTNATRTQHPARMTIARPAPLRRLLPAARAFALCFAAGAGAQEAKLPDIGSSAGTLLSPARQAEYGAMVLAQLRHEGYILDDPLLDGWLRDVGQRLAASTDRPQQGFTFFMLRDRQINAF